MSVVLRTETVGGKVVADGEANHLAGSVGITEMEAEVYPAFDPTLGIAARFEYVRGANDGPVANLFPRLQHDSVGSLPA